MSRTFCYHCSGGNHGDCTTSFCLCPMPQCVKARQDESWLVYSVAGVAKGKLKIAESNGRLIFKPASNQ